MDLLAPDETELALLGGQGTLFECGVKTIVATKGGNGYEICTSADRKRTDCIRFRLRPPADLTVEFTDKPDLGQQTACAKFVISVKIWQYN